MLQELDQNQIMADAKKQKLTIHHSNLFYPTPIGITGLAQNVEKTYMVLTREHSVKDKINIPLTIIEIYQIYPNLCPKPVQSIIEYETLTGIVWLNSKTILSVSKEQTINFYRTKDGSKISSLMTDYGPILCMKYLDDENLLVIGTEYGYVALYKVDIKNRKIELLNKMVKINGKITSIDFCCKKKNEVKASLPEPKATKLKRKRADSSDEESDDDVERPDENFLDMHDIIIYAASNNTVTAYDYHKKSIIDTLKVNSGESFTVSSLLALKNGDCVVGDSTGTLSIFDKESLTCKQTMNVLKSSASCLAIDSKETTLLVSGDDPSIFTLKRNEQGSFVLFDNVQIHSHRVTSMIVGKKGCYSGSLDGRLIKFKPRPGQSMTKVVTLPDYTDKIRFYKGEMMIQGEKSLTIWKLPPPASLTSPRKSQSVTNKEAEQVKPVKLLLLRARAFIHASTFSDRWISYSTRKDIHIFDRFVEGLKSYRPDQKLPQCSKLEIYLDNKFLAAASGKSIYVVNLEKSPEADDETMKVTESDNKTAKVSGRPSLCVVHRINLKSTIRQIMSIDSMDRLAIVCSSPENLVYTYKYQIDSEATLTKEAKFCSGYRAISFISYNGANKRDSYIYTYTSCDQVIKIDPKKPDTDLMALLDSRDRIDGLPEDALILGMFVISKDYCILYDNHRVFKVDINSNKLINTISNFKYIMKMDNFVFQKYDQVALAELDPYDYQKSLPKCSVRTKKFGNL